MADDYCRFVDPEEVRLPISRGDWLLVKKELNAGEQQDIFKRMIAKLPQAAAPGAVNGSGLEIDPIQATLSTALAYLLDWSLTKRGRPMVIRDQPPEAIAAVLRGLDPPSFHEIIQAIQTHDEAMTRERDRLRALPFGETASLAT